MSQRKRRGFTLVELLVVISIIGMLAALLLPAINGAREAGRRTQCLNNQRQLAVAVTRYVDAKNQFPGYANIQVSYPGASGKVDVPCTWVFPLLPFLERTDLFEMYGPKNVAAIAAGTQTTTPVANLKVLLCPSDIDAEGQAAGTGGALSYVVNTGQQDIPRNNETSSDNFRRDWPGNGVFFDLYPDYDDSSKRIPVTTMTTGFISSGDGMTNTLMLSENADGGNWNETDMQDAAAGGHSGNVMEERVGFVWWPGVDSSSGIVIPPDRALTAPLQICGINEGVGQAINVPVPDSAALRKAWYARPGSYHQGGVVATFCDSHTQILSDGLDYHVYCLLMTPRGKDAYIVREENFFGESGSPDTCANLFGTANPFDDPLNEGDF